MSLEGNPLLKLGQTKLYYIQLTVHWSKEVPNDNKAVIVFLQILTLPPTLFLTTEVSNMV